MYELFNQFGIEQLTGNAVFQPLPDFGEFDITDYFIGKRKGQQTSGRILIHSPGAQVEQHVFIKPAHCGAVTALDVIRVNLQFRFGIDLCVAREQQVCIGLVGLGLLGLFMYDNLAVKHGARVSVHNAPVVFVADRMGLFVLYQGVVVHMLALIGQV